MPETSLTPGGPIQPVFRIFVSHIHENEEVANKLKEFLEAAFHERIDIFISGDPASISITEDWLNKIKEGIKTCDLMIILCTPQSVNRPWIHFKAGAAEILGKKIGPLCFSGQSAGVLPSPLSIIRCQAVDDSDEIKFEGYFEGLMRIVAEYIGVDVPEIDVLGSDFYQTIKIARPEFSKLDQVIVRTFLIFCDRIPLSRISSPSRSLLSKKCWRCDKRRLFVGAIAVTAGGGVSIATEC